MRAVAIVKLCVLHCECTVHVKVHATLYSTEQHYVTSFELWTDNGLDGPKHVGGGI